MQTEKALSKNLEKLLVQTQEGSEQVEAAQKKITQNQKRISRIIERRAKNARQKLCHELRSVDYYFDSLRVEVQLAKKEISVVLDDMRYRLTSEPVPKGSFYFGPEGFDKVVNFFKKFLPLPVGWSLCITFDSSYYSDENDSD